MNIGIAGIGFMGMIHYKSYAQVRGMKVRAICETDPVRLSGDWTSIKGNFGPPGEHEELKGIARYAEIDALLADPKLDVIDICLPPALHAEVAVKALAAGKHVFCEKPIALSAADGKKMCDAAEKAGKMLLVGHVLPFFPEYQFAYKAITGGKYGRLLGGHFKRIISDPLWLKDFYDPKKVGGPMLDLHVHDAHFIRVVCGMPKAVQSAGRMRGEVVEQFSTQFVFDDPELVVTAASGVIRQQGRSFTHAYEIYLEKATLLFDVAVIDGQGQTLMPVTVLESSGKVVRPELPGGDAFTPFVAELNEVSRAIRTGKPSPLLAGELARDAVTICQRQTESVRRGKAVKI